MDVRQINALVAIADHGTFSAAARALFTVQSNVSGHIARLERELHTTLVDRANGGLTGDGHRVVERGRRIQYELDRISADIASSQGKVTGEPRIGIIGTTARWLLPPVLEALAVDHPGLHLIAQEGGTSTLVPGVIDGRLDGAVLHLPVDDPELVNTPLFAEDLVLVVPPAHPLAGRESMHLVELAHHPLLLPPRGTALRRILDRAAAANEIALAPMAEIDGVRSLAFLVADGFGPAIVPATALSRSEEANLSRIAVPELPQRVVAWTTRRRPEPTTAVRVLFDTLQQVVTARAPTQANVYIGLDAFPFAAHG